MKQLRDRAEITARQDENAQRLRELRAAGYSYKECAEELNMHRRTLEILRTRYNIEPTGGGKQKVDDEEVAELFSTGMNAVQIAKETGFSQSTVRRSLSRSGLHRNILASAPAKLARAKELLDDGASYAEAARSTGAYYVSLRKEFPNLGWSLHHSSKFRVEVHNIIERAKARGIDLSEFAELEKRPKR